VRLALPPLASRALALLLLFGAVGLAYLAVIQPLWDDAAATQQSIADMQSAIERYRRVAAELPARRATLAALRQQQATSQGFLTGPNDALVAAQIQNRLKASIEAAHGELKSTQVLPVQEEGKYRRVIIRAQAVLDLPAAQRVIYDIETASPMLFLDNVALRSRMVERRRDRAGEDGTLDVRFDVYGYVRGAEPPPPQSAAVTAPGRDSAAAQE
jgi:general secretion pathway protein M